MSPGSRPVGRLLVTGVPGWLTAAMLDSLQRDPLPGLQSVKCLVEPTMMSTVSLPRDPPFPIESVAVDLRDAAGLTRAAEGADTIFHAAGILHVRRTQDWYDINTTGTQRLLDAAMAGGASRFVLVSSNAAAGRADRRDHLLTEDDPPRPLSHYGRSKLLAEQALLAAGNRIQTVSLRPCMFYGPPVPARHIEIYKRIMHGRMPLVGTGDYARSVSHIDNLVQGCRLALVHPAAAGQTYYISDRPVYTTLQIVEAMAEACGVRPRYLRLPRLVGPVAYTGDAMLAKMQLYWQTLHLVGESHWHVGVSCEKARRELGYEPTVELLDGMKKAVEWCRRTGKL